jgi:peptidoglycan/xylan/chitin deacetylase (PgdA/CDA1 family)
VRGEVKSKIARGLGVRRARRSPRQAGAALVYHRVGDPPGDPRLELVPSLGVRLFEEQLLHLQRTYHVVSPSRLLDAMLDRRAGDRFPVAITFDDDLRSHVDIAAPMLLSGGLPAAFFLCGAVAGATSSFWWEDLQELVDHPDAEPLQLRSWPELDLAPAARRTPYAIHEAAGLIERLPPERRDAVAAELRGRVRPRPRGLTASDTGTLASSGFEIGFHTRRHYLLTTLDDTTLGTALTEGRQELDAAARQRLRMLAYPHGKADQRVAEAARSAGYDYGFTASDACVFPDTDALLLGRVEAQAVPIGYFARSLAALLAAG